MFNLKIPCDNCPFRKEIGPLFRLGSERLEEIRAATAFPCHKTINLEEGEKPSDKTNQCAGLMAVLHREGTPNQIMQVAQRFGHLNPDELDPRNEAYEAWSEALKAHE